MRIRDCRANLRGNLIQDELEPWQDLSGLNTSRHPPPFYTYRISFCYSAAGGLLLPARVAGGMWVRIWVLIGGLKSLRRPLFAAFAFGPANCCQFNILTQLLNFYLRFLFADLTLNGENPAEILSPLFKPANSFDMSLLFSEYKNNNCELVISILLPLLSDNSWMLDSLSFQFDGNIFPIFKIR